MLYVELHVIDFGIVWSKEHVN